MIKINKFWNRILLSDHNDDECWHWDGPTNYSGYGVLYYNGKNTYVHRLSYELFRGIIPHGLVIDHLCKNTLCVNPNHLEVVTQRINVLRSNGLPSKNIQKTHCVYGHEFTSENTYIKPNGARNCKKCIRNSKIKYIKSKARIQYKHLSSNMIEGKK